MKLVVLDRHNEVAWTCGDEIEVKQIEHPKARDLAKRTWHDGIGRKDAGWTVKVIAE